MIRFFIALLIAITASYFFQLSLPPLLLLKGAGILLVPAIYYYGCLALPFPLMLMLTLYTGALHDLLLVPQSSPGNDYPTGFSVLTHLLPGLLLHGLRPLFLRNRWEMHWLLAEVCALLTPFPLLAEYAILSFQRREIYLSDVIIWRILGPGLISIVIAPCVFFILTPLSHALRYRPGLDVTR